MEADKNENMEKDELDRYIENVISANLCPPEIKGEIEREYQKIKTTDSDNTGKLIHLCNKIKAVNLKEKFKDYKFEIDWVDSKLFNPKHECADVKLTTKNGDKYYSTFITRSYIDYLFEKNKKTGECANGTYFCMPAMVIIKEVDNKNIKITIDELIENLEVESYFKKYD